MSQQTKSITANKRIRYLWLVAVVLCAISLRVAFIGHFLWIDESFTATVITQPCTIIAKITAKDVHPPLYYFALHGWYKIGVMLYEPNGAKFTLLDYYLEHQGEPAQFEAKLQSGGIDTNFEGLTVDNWNGFCIPPLTFLRLYNLLCGVGAIVVLFLLTSRLFKNSLLIPVVSSLLYSISPFSVFWDTVIRNYSMLNFLMLLSSYLLILSVQKPNPVKYVLFALSVFFMLMTHYTGFFYLPVFLAVAWYGKQTQKNTKECLTIGLGMAVVIFGVLWGATMISQTQLVAPEQSTTFSATVVNIFGGLPYLFTIFWKFLFSSAPWMEVTSFSHPVLYYFAFIFFSIIVIFSVIDIVKKVSVEKVFIMLCLFVPASAGIIANSVNSQSVYPQTRYFYSCLPWFVVFISFGIHNLLSRAHRKSRSGK